MEVTILKATERSENPKNARKAGFTPGVLNEHDTTSTSVQFDSAELNKLLVKHGSNAKVWIEMNKKKRFGVIKEVQKSPVEGKVIHVSIQLISKDQEIKMILPITFHGREDLTNRSLELHVTKSEIEVEGKASLMPDTVLIDVSKRALGDIITMVDFVLPKGITMLDAKHETYATIKVRRGALVEEPAEATPAQ